MLQNVSATSRTVFYVLSLCLCYIPILFHCTVHDCMPAPYPDRMPPHSPVYALVYCLYVLSNRLPVACPTIPPVIMPFLCPDLISGTAQATCLSCAHFLVLTHCFQFLYLPCQCPIQWAFLHGVLQRAFCYYKVPSSFFVTFPHFLCTVPSL